MIRFLAAAGLLAVCLDCAGAEEQFSKSYGPCMEKSGGATFAMQDCISGELKHQDKRLNEAYRALLASAGVGDKRKAQLRDAQRKWIAFRDANCTFYGDPAGGQAARLAANECVLSQTALRAAELEALRPE